MKKLLFGFLVCCFLTSCYHSQSIVGNGPAGSSVEKGKNQYFIFGLAPGKQADTKAMSGGASDYKIEIEHSFVDGLLGLITFGIYHPTTVTVTK